MHRQALKAARAALLALRGGQTLAPLEGGDLCQPSDQRPTSKTDGPFALWRGMRRGVPQMMAMVSELLLRASNRTLPKLPGVCWIACGADLCDNRCHRWWHELATAINLAGRIWPGDSRLRFWRRVPAKPKP